MWPSLYFAFSSLRVSSILHSRKMYVTVLDGFMWSILPIIPTSKRINLSSRYRYGERESSVAWLCDLLHFGQLFKVCGNNYFAQIAHILGNFCYGAKIFHFSSGINFRQLFIDIWQLFTGHWQRPKCRLTR